MKISFEQVRLALIAHAERKNRPSLDIYVVKEVVEAIRMEKWHPLKMIALQEIFANKAIYNLVEQPPPPVIVYDPDEFLEKVLLIKKHYSGQKKLSIKSGVSERTISLICKQKSKVTQTICRKLAPVIDDVIKDLEETEHNNSQKHGWYVTYRKGCRCCECKKAWSEYIIANRKKRLKAEQRDC